VVKADLEVTKKGKAEDETTLSDTNAKCKATRGRSRYGCKGGATEG